MREISKVYYKDSLFICCLFLSLLGRHPPISDIQIISTLMVWILLHFFFTFFFFTKPLNNLTLYLLWTLSDYMGHLKYQRELVSDSLVSVTDKRKQLKFSSFHRSPRTEKSLISVPVLFRRTWGDTFLLTSNGLHTVISNNSSLTEIRLTGTFTLIQKNAWKSLSLIRSSSDFQSTFL